MRGRIVGIVMGMVLIAGAVTAWAQAPAAGAQPPPSGEAGIVDMGPVVVSGVQPGPGLWQVRRGDHTLYVLGEVSPLPRDIDWNTDEVEAVIARAQTVIAAPQIELRADVGRLRTLLMVPALLRARRNPDGKQLQEVVPPTLYARWVPLKARWIGRSDRVERWRPVFAAGELYASAIARMRMRQDGIIEPVVTRLAKAHRVPIVRTDLEIRVDDTKAALREFGGAPLDDLPCFERMLARIERDLQHMGERANAWAVGDIDALRALQGENTYTVCMRTFTQGALAKRLGVEDVDRRVEAQWLQAAETALAQNQTTFAVLPMSLVLGEHGYLAKLAAKGYEVQAP
ncbi:TraB/GumN family protein [Luteimonas sp. S4-F44]|uniref:TraB/GumN family protein n=1 Tax=Luteimonas sp. S4-F44 TaxID=2925842 RepID=UPI001F538DBE|nr:TraB/GumN family protein [Luteimonas sp. S4-F44]UNK41625.1 TraB/GumN family protein [Luteimonas sp. S4-F44]